MIADCRNDYRTSAGEPLLFKGGDFAHTDIVAKSPAHSSFSSLASSDRPCEAVRPNLGNHQFG